MMPIEEDVNYQVFRAMARGASYVTYKRTGRTWYFDDVIDRQDLRGYVTLAFRQINAGVYYGNLTRQQLANLMEKLNK